jgi:hypothetical protein
MNLNDHSCLRFGALCFAHHASHNGKEWLHFRLLIFDKAPTSRAEKTVLSMLDLYRQVEMGHCI